MNFRKTPDRKEESNIIAKLKNGEIVEILEGPVKVGACFGCPQAAMCGQKDVWSEVGDKVRQTIEGKTLKDLIK